MAALRRHTDCANNDVKITVIANSYNYRGHDEHGMVFLSVRMGEMKFLYAPLPIAEKRRIIRASDYTLRVANTIIR